MTDSHQDHALPKMEQTSLGLYVTAKEAYDMWKADPESAYHGKRMRNGWKNAGLPWIYDPDPELTQFDTGHLTLQP